MENLHEESLVAQRIICDHLQAVGGILKVNISNELMISARQKYMSHLEMKRNEKLREEGTNKRKSVLDEIDEMKTKKKRIKTDIDSLMNASADQFAEKDMCNCGSDNLYLALGDVMPSPSRSLQAVFVYSLICG